MNDVAELLKARLADLDQARARAKEEYVYLYIGQTPAAGAQAEMPTINRNVMRVRQNDPRPPNVIYWSHSFYGLIRWFDQATRKTGVNVWRWK